MDDIIGDARSPPRDGWAPEIRGAVAFTAMAHPSVRSGNWRRVQLDSVFIGVVNASGTFLPVFLLRLGASANDVGLLTALPAFTAFALAIPFGRWMQRRRNIVPWYSRLRLVAWSSYAVMAAVAAILPREQAIPVLLAVWALASLPSTAALVGFAMVMDGAAGPGGRFDLLGRRWAIAGVVATVAVALGGQLLSAFAFPTNFEILLVIVSLAGLGSYFQSSRLVIPDQVPVVSSAQAPVRERLAGLWRLIVANRPFVRFELRGFVYVASIGMSMPVLPLFYVHEVGAPDAWIGVIGSAGSAGSVLGYLVARQLARRRGATMTLLPSLLAAAIAPALLSFVGWLPAVAALAFVTGVAGAGAQLAMFDQMLRTIPAEHGVTFSSVDQSLSNAAIMIAPVVGGLLTVAFGVRETLLVVSLVGLVALVLFALDARQRAASTTTVPEGGMP
ncbi:MAG: MFS transporter [Chloroflexi bacterium]|nr:MFS transporter [Chloroflexota bacterium]